MQVEIYGEISTTDAKHIVSEIKSFVPKNENDHLLIDLCEAEMVYFTYGQIRSAVEDLKKKGYDVEAQKSERDTALYSKLIYNMVNEE